MKFCHQNQENHFKQWYKSWIDTYWNMYFLNSQSSQLYLFSFFQSLYQQCMTFFDTNISLILIDYEDYFWYWIKTVLEIFGIESVFDSFKMKKVLDTFRMKTVSPGYNVTTFQVQNCIDVWCHQDKQVREGRRFCPSIRQSFFLDRKSMLILVFQSVHGSLDHWIVCHSVHRKNQSYHFHHHRIHSLDWIPWNRDHSVTWLRSKSPTKMALISSRDQTSMVVLLTFSLHLTHPGLILWSNHCCLCFQCPQTGAEIVEFQVILLL